MNDTIICIPSKGRCKDIKTLTMLKDCPFPIRLVVYEDELQDYQYYNPDIECVVCPVRGIGVKRNWILCEHFKDYEYVIMVDDDIEKLIQVVDMKDIDININDKIDEVKKELVERDAYLGGFCLCPNRFFAKPTITETLKHVASDFSIWRKKENEAPPLVDLRHFEDYVHCIEMFLRDGKIVRFNDIIVITDNYTEQGGICGEMGSLKARLDYAEIKAQEIEDKYGRKIVRKTFKKKSARGPECYNLRLNHHFKIK